MYLLIDIGNTAAKLAVSDGSTLLHTMYVNAPWADTFSHIRQNYPIHRCAVSTVAAEDKALKQALASQPFPTLWLTAETPCPLRNIPHGYGADRLAADIGAWAQTPSHPLLVIDAGTCITYDLFNHQGELLGGIISPGIQLRLKAMHEHTALLPLFEAETSTPLIGFNTKDSMMSSAIHGTRYELEGYIRTFLAQYPHLKVYLTGGNTFQLSPDLASHVTHDPHLLFRGLQNLLASTDQEHIAVAR